MPGFADCWKLMGWEHACDEGQYGLGGAGCLNELRSLLSQIDVKDTTRNARVGWMCPNLKEATFVPCLFGVEALTE